MKNVEEYVISHKGIKREDNEDNLYACGYLLPEKHDDIKNYEKKIRKTNNLLYAVFDGMGGLNDGAKASHLGVSILHRHKDKKIIDIVRTINEEIQKEDNIGSTASIIRINKDTLEYITVGDSPIYILSGDNFIKIREKEDDTNLLDNYLGKDEIGAVADKTKLKNNDKILLCSDGLCNEMNDVDIEYILSSSNDPKYIGDKLLNYALSNGGRENITMIVLVVKNDYKEIIYLVLLLIIVFLVLFLIF